MKETIPELPEPLREIVAPSLFEVSSFADVERCPLSVFGARALSNDAAQLLTPIPAVLSVFLANYVRTELEAGRWDGNDASIAADVLLDSARKQVETRLANETPGIDIVPLHDAVGRKNWRRLRRELLGWVTSRSLTEPVGQFRELPDLFRSFCGGLDEHLAADAEEVLSESSLRLVGKPGRITVTADGSIEVTTFKSFLPREEGTSAAKNGDGQPDAVLEKPDADASLEPDASLEETEPDSGPLEPPLLPEADITRARLYGMLVQAKFPGRIIRLFIEDLERHEISLTPEQFAELEERLATVCQRVPAGKPIPAESLASPGPHCASCLVRHRCVKYQAAAPKWWSNVETHPRLLPMDVWGTVVEAGTSAVGAKLSLDDAAGRRVLINHLKPEHGLRDFREGGEAWLFDLEASEDVGQQGATLYPRNFHELAPGPRWPSSRRLRVFRGRRSYGPYLTRFHAKHLKLLRLSAPLDFKRPDGTPRMWTVIIGENGTCKTGLLQAIALAAAGWRKAGELSGDVRESLRDRRLSASGRPLEIEATFQFGPGDLGSRVYPGLPHAQAATSPVELVSQVFLPEGSNSFRGSSRYASGGTDDPLFEARDRDLGGWFVVGYGVFRDLPSPLREPAIGSGSSVKRLSSLFRGGEPLLATAFANVDGEKGERFRRVLNGLLEQVRNLLPGIQRAEFAERVEGMDKIVERHRFIQSLPDGDLALPSTWLSHGFQSSIAWIADLVGHFITQTDLDVTPEDMEGLVLIDEIDLFIHPSWQIQIIRALKRAFPRVQFIATSHSPLVLAGLRPDHDEVLRLVTDGSDGDVVLKDMREGRPHEPDARVMTATEIVRTYFGVDSLFPARLGNLLREHRHLAADEFRSVDDEHRLDEMEIELRKEGVEPDFPREPRRTS